MKGMILMNKLLPLLAKELTEGRCVVLVTVTRNGGSAPRGVGACLLRRQDGTFAGTVGGGVLEFRCLTEAGAMLGHSSGHVEEYALTQNEVRSLGMVCGGNVCILYQALTPEDLPAFAEALTRMQTGQSLWMARRLENGTVASLCFYGVDEPCPFLPDAADGEAHPRRAHCAHDILIEPVQLAFHTYVFGGGHVSQALVPLLAQLDFAPIVYDDRPEFTSKTLFPTAADVICRSFDEAHALPITHNDEIVIMTRGHVNDHELLVQALRTDAYFIGLIGSRSKIAHTKALLLQEGFSEDDFARVSTPIGLPIKAETPMEIAVSVSAEMILRRAEASEIV